MRDYKKEYKDYHGKPEQIANRSSRNKARRKMSIMGRAKKGDGKEEVRPLRAARDDGHFVV